jgi:glucose dehydrogenase
VGLLAAPSGSATLSYNEASPIVIDGTLYISSSTGPKGAFARDAKTGALKWQLQPDVAEDVQPCVCCDVDSRG